MPWDQASTERLLAASLRMLHRDAEAAQADRRASAALEPLAGRATAPGNPAAKAAPGGPLSAREIEVLRLVADGLPDRAIADRLFLSPHTVHRHVANILTKLGLSSRAAAVAVAARLDLIG